MRKGWKKSKHNAMYYTSWEMDIVYIQVMYCIYDVDPQKFQVQSFSQPYLDTQTCRIRYKPTAPHVCGYRWYSASTQTSLVCIHLWRWRQASWCQAFSKSSRLLKMNSRLLSLKMNGHHDFREWNEKSWFHIVHGYCYCATCYDLLQRAHIAGVRAKWDCAQLLPLPAIVCFDTLLRLASLWWW